MSAIAPIAELREKAEANELRLQIFQQETALRTIAQVQITDALESYYDPANFVNVNDYLGDGRRRAHSSLFSWPTTKNDREDGKMLPIFQTEQELATIRGAARVLATCNGRIVGVLNNLANYIIGKGFEHKVLRKRQQSPARATAFESHGDLSDQQCLELVDDAQRVIDEFKKTNDWSSLSRELFIRSRRDGEYFLGLWASKRQNTETGMDEHVSEARVIEPDQVTEPSNPRVIEDWLGIEDRPSSWSFGVHCDADDVVNVHGYYVQWTNRPTGWDYLSGGRQPLCARDANGNPIGCVHVEHLKCNVDSNVKRGLSDLFSVDSTAELARKLLRNTGEGGALQAAIAWIREVQTPDRTTLEKAIEQRADLTQSIRTAGGGTRTSYTTQYEPGTILTPSPGTVYKPGPMGSQNAPNLITIEEALLRALAVRWNAPEHMISGSAHNNNFASILVSGDPFVVSGEVEQQKYADAEERIMWKVLYFAWKAGELRAPSWHQVRQNIEVDVKGADIAVRDPDKETDRRKVLNESGILSAKTWATLEGLDHDEEVTNGVRLLGLDPAAPATGAEPATPAATQPPAINSPSAPSPGVTGAGVQTDLTLNGAQIDSARGVLADVQLGRLAPYAATELLVGVGLERNLAKLAVEAQQQLPPPVVPQPPAAASTSPPAADPSKPANALESEHEPPERTLTRRILDVLLWRSYP
jgi:hypothetical protein